MVDMKLAQAKGFSFGPATKFMDFKDPRAMVKDAAVLDPNATVPAYMRTYANPRIIEVLTAERAYRKIAPEVKNGDFTTAFTQFRSIEFTGDTTPYGDYDGNGVSGVNTAFPVREQYRFQTTIKVGDLEQKMNAEAKIDLFAEKQKSAAINIDIAFNKYALYGVAGKAVYGLLNDPSLNAAITPIVVNSTQTKWEDKTANQEMNDLNKLVASLYTQAAGHIDDSTRTKLLVSPATLAAMNKLNDYGVSVKKMIADTYPNMTIVVVPELYNATLETSTMVLLADEILGQPTVEFGYADKYYAHEIVRDLSSWKQKVSAGTYGAIVQLPFAIGSMTGI
jgi:hypothetical protein